MEAQLLHHSLRGEGFWLIANATLYYMGRIYRGLMVFDRAIHRSVGCSAAGAGQPIVFSCMVIYSPNGPCIAPADAYNPSPAKPLQPWSISSSYTYPGEPRW